VPRFGPGAIALLSRSFYFTGFEWHRLQSACGKATVPWQTPQNFPSSISFMEYIVNPFLPPAKISG
jgi:hypothetical protein